MHKLEKNALCATNQMKVQIKVVVVTVAVRVICSRVTNANATFFCLGVHTVIPNRAAVILCAGVTGAFAAVSAVPITALYVQAFGVVAVTVADI